MSNFFKVCLRRIISDPPCSDSEIALTVFKRKYDASPSHRAKVSHQRLNMEAAFGSSSFGVLSERFYLVVNRRELQLQVTDSDIRPKYRSITFQNPAKL